MAKTGSHAIKNAREIKYLEKAAKITKNIFNVISKRVKPGVRESEIASELENIIKKKGLKRSFRAIVASGENTAKPHAKITGRKIKKNDVVVLDFGVIYKGYHSDMTRTIIVGKIDSRMRKLCKTVKGAQDMAIGKIAPGVKISDFVRRVYDYIKKNDLGKYILHSLGHGVGKRVHEAPKLSEKNTHMLKKNMVITIEPGLYIKGTGGVRIEDMVRISQNGVKVLTR